MKTNITQALIKELKPGEYTVFDKTERRLALRVRPSGAMTWRVRLKTEAGTWYWWTLGPVDSLKPEKARAQAHVAKGKAADRDDPRDAKQQQAIEAKRQITLGTFITDQYAPWARANLKSGEATVKTLESQCKDFLDTSLPDLTPFAIEKFRSGYLKRGRTQATVNRIVATLKACVSKAVLWRVLDHHPLAGLKLAKLDTLGRLRFLSDDEEKRLREALTAREASLRAGRDSFNAWRAARGYKTLPAFTGYADHLQPVVLAALLTGARRGELFDLRWADVDVARAGVTFADTKSGLSRRVPLCVEALTALRAWRDQQPAKRKAPEALVFPSPQTGKRLNNINTAWSGLVTAAQLKDFTFHDLRHSFASKLAQRGVGLFVIQKLLGHASPIMTQRYSHLTDDQLTEAVAKLAG